MGYRGDAADPYVDAETGVLLNLAGLRDAELLEGYEGEMSIMRQFELSLNPSPADFDLTHLKAIHRSLFQDIYSWAGEVRTVDISKGTSRFGSHLHVESYLGKGLRSARLRTGELEALPRIGGLGRSLRPLHGRNQCSAPFPGRKR
jgi:fido (protein-threonine AMPylation protein)